MKMKMMKSLQLGMVAMTALALSACGDQDPLASQPDYIRNATPGFQKPAPAVANDENMLITSNLTHFLFTESVEGQVTITGRILLDNYESGLVVDNLMDFAGATFDPATGIFAWTPPRGFVTGTNSTRTTFVRMRLNGIQTETSITATKIKDFPVTVSRMERQPTIVKETGFPLKAAREGDSLRLVIFVKDEDATNVVGQKPRIFVQAPTNEPRVGDLTPYIRVVSEDNPDQDFNDPTQYKFSLNVNLQDVDVTKNSGDYYFRVTAISRFGKTSATKEYRIAVNTDVQYPILSSENFEATVGIDMVQDVLVVDPRQEGRVSVEVLNPKSLPEGFKFNCTTSTSKRWMSVCRATWSLSAPVIRVPIPVPDPVVVPVPIPVPADPTPSPTPDESNQSNPVVLPAPSFDAEGKRVVIPPAAVGTEARIRIRATNSSPVSLDTYSVYRDYDLKFKVVAK